MTVHVFGIRHHGPGCARALEAALEELVPDIVLIEGPPEADEVVALAADPAMRPPVALLVHPVDAPRLGVFYPFAEFSPEWRAIRHALARQVPVRFIDLPPTHGFAAAMAREAQASDRDAPGAAPAEPLPDARDEMPAIGAVPETTEEKPAGEADAARLERSLRMDPIGELSRAAGYDDEELWWEIEVEQRRDAAGLFAAIAEAMIALRAHAPAPDPGEARREAHMRLRIREAQKAGHERIAVVCGAWHLPALVHPASMKDDQALLKGLPKTRVAATWVPWSNDRLAYASGYGAGVTSPGWYLHLWRSPDRAAIRWATEAARLLRDEDIDASSASVIETVRLAETLAALRGWPLPGLTELREALLSVLCHGAPAPLALIHRRLEVGDLLGEVPATAAAAPLLRDLEAQQKRLRLKPSTEVCSLDLDLRDEGARDRSRLLHRLVILDIEWGRPLDDRNRTGTFREGWELRWNPEMAVALVAASRYGNTIEDAAGSRLRERAAGATLPDLTAMLDSAVLARLPGAIAALLAAVSDRAAIAADLGHLMDALPPLVRVARYGDVRGTGTENVLPIVSSLVDRICVGIVPASIGIDETAAGELVARIEAVQAALDMLDQAELRDGWLDSLADLADDEQAVAQARGYALRLRFDRRRVEAEEVARRARLVLAPAVAPAQSAGWLTGLLRGSGLLLLQHEALWIAIDEWLQGLTHEVFVERLPLLRRAFSGFSPAERRQMGEKVRHLGGAGGARPDGAHPGGTRPGMPGEEEIDVERAALVLPVLAAILGAPPVQGDLR